ncbi:MAG: hypothetical protein M0000_12080 [Actinomycetota bacterium]|nr:hypothetical protein [Actinomycetota bacterium]MDA8207584.1 hypothetical protein [Actinomycetota bacterium]
MSATLKVTRAAFGIELRRGRFDISVDGTSVGSIDHGATVEAEIAAGRHSLQIRRGRYSSRIAPFEVDDGEVASFLCHGAAVWPRYLASIFKPDLAISLRRAQSADNR